MTSEAAQAVREGLWLFGLSWFLARLEIEIEGAHGWAEKLPTWRWGPDWFLDLTNGKDLTGYGLYLTLFLLSIFHLPIVFAGFSRALEAKCLSSYLLMTATWDLQWFAWNPAWGLEGLRARPVAWFRKKLLGFPVDYYVAVVASYAATALVWSPGLRQWLVRTATVGAASALALLAAAWARPRASVKA